jgi:prephenate dehydrogenase
MKEIKKISVVGIGLLGASVLLAVQRAMAGGLTVGFSHRQSTRQKARDLEISHRVCDDIGEAVKESDLVILATPITIFEQTFKEIAPYLKKGCIITDVGSTKQLVHKWAGRALDKKVFYVGSHPIAGSEKRGLEFARDDLFNGANCIITSDSSTNKQAINVVENFWKGLGSIIYRMSPDMHDKVLADISHLPHILAAALVNASDFEELKYAGKGFLDTSRIASGPANIWTDIFLTNSANTSRAIDRVIRQLNKLKDAVKAKDIKKIETLLEQARSKREQLVNYKIGRGEIL